MQSTWVIGVPPPPPPPPELPPPPQPAKPETMPPSMRAQANAYTSRRCGERPPRRVVTMTSKPKMAATTAGSAIAGGVPGVWRDGLKKSGGAFERVGERDAVHVPPVVVVPAFGVQVTGEPSACVPFMN